jgi:predicted cupin superfamily sugar epimerase
MHPRAAELIALLELQPHPEGGYYREIFRSSRQVQPFDARPRRGALTLIHFLLLQGMPSRWHQVVSDEAWSWVEGGELELLRMDAGLGHCESLRLGPPAAGVGAAAVIASHQWQAARALGPYVLVTCAVAPGFEFSDFRLLADDAEAAARLRELHPQFAGLI